ncbi:MAG TPA: glycosyltransferase family 4 protein [Solirubrobacteraceae bacterium]|nr:glycosyltransferase family 4 protein [Solirubrobacteraceae bacterium]
MSAKPAVSLLYVRYPHHSRWSGYPRFTEYLDGMVRARHVGPTLGPRVVTTPAFKLHPLPKLSPRVLGFDLSAARRLALGRGEVVHLLYGETDSNYFYSDHLHRFGHLRGNVLVSTFHQPVSLLGTQKIFDHLDAAIALGTQAGAFIAGIMGSQRVFRASLGVDAQAWHPDQSQKAPAPVLMFVGTWLRDFSLLGRVVRLLVAEEPRVRFEIVTGFGHGEALAELSNVTVHEGISDEELRRLYQRAWVHVLPLIDGTGTNALLEGMACGLPTVTSAVGDVVDYTGKHGAICVRPDDANAMADAVLGLIRDRRRRDELGRAAREAAEVHRLEVTGRRHAEIYCTLAGRRRASVFFAARAKSQPRA